jgi:anthranilate synthase component 1
VAKDICCIPKLAEARRLALAHNVVPVTHAFLSDLETPVSAFLKLGAPRRAFLLESADRAQRLDRYSFLGVWARALVTYRDGRLTVDEDGRRLEIEHDDPFTAAADLLAGYRMAPRGDLPPLAGGLVGYFGYDLVRRLERLPEPPPDELGLPDMAFLLADTVLVFDHVRHTVTVVANAFVDGCDVESAYADAVRRIAEVKARLREPLPASAYAGGANEAGGAQPPPALPASSMTRAAYEAGVERIREHIFAGDAFQVVLSQRFSTPVTVGPFSVYRSLRAVNPSPYMFFISFDDFSLVGSSPEPLVRVTGRRAELRPIAGTRRRGADDAEDRELIAELLADEKERAEHVMLVDLGRNDLGRVCRPGSVHVDELMAPELYSHVIHLVSSVSGELAPERTAIDALKAAFPAGTVSGAPKVRAMEIIDALETTRRGPYAGAMGYLSYTGDLDTCLCIRTIVFKDGVAHIQAGAGVVADSVPAREHEETRQKAAALLRAIELAHEEFGAPGAEEAGIDA